MNKIGCKLSYLFPFSGEAKTILDRNWSKNYLPEKNFTQFSKEKLLKSFFILEIFVFPELRPKNSAPETQTYNSDPLK